MNTFQEILAKIEREHPLRISIAKAEDHEVLLAVQEALKLNFVKFHLVGDEQRIRQTAKEIKLSLDNIEITNELTEEGACRAAVHSVSIGDSQILMKGLVPTAKILKAVLDKEIGLRTGKVLSHVAAFELSSYDKLIFLTDAAMNIAPDLHQKVQIIENAVELAHSLGIRTPKVASIAAVETINPNMQATIDAALLSKMSERGQLKGMIVDGPLALDIAISLEAANHKGIKSQVAGLADILLVPNIEVGNALYKSLVYFARAKVGAVIMGAKSPIVLTSRADSSETKLNSMILAVLSAQQNKANNN